MYSSRHAAIALTAMCIAFVLYVDTSTASLPSRLATHFDGAGRPNGWMSRDAHEHFITLFGVGMAAFPALMALLLRFIPISLVNIPHRMYWLSAERAPASMEYLRRHLIVLGCLFVGLMTAVQWSTVRANLLQPPRMMTGDILLIIGGFIATMLLWSVTLLLRFARKPSAAGSAWVGRAGGPT